MGNNNTRRFPPASASRSVPIRNIWSCFVIILYKIIRKMISKKYRINIILYFLDFDIQSRLYDLCLKNDIKFFIIAFTWLNERLIIWLYHWYFITLLWISRHHLSNNIITSVGSGKNSMMFSCRYFEIISWWYIVYWIIISSKCYISSYNTYTDSIFMTVMIINYSSIIMPFINMYISSIF